MERGRGGEQGGTGAKELGGGRWSAASPGRRRHRVRGDEGLPAAGRPKGGDAGDRRAMTKRMEPTARGWTRKQRAAASFARGEIEQNRATIAKIDRVIGCGA
ncbi:hypothetical protein GUJ93_ZPchr0856g2767 [Zizania palustris]|uniref:Uncharacterized protein n=1 Tax=Zizania palustris TaxID=103762 RepID=A0A8J5UV27_ZIZPA|nr:hypothetical protein GUJ93_ZPchr0856g2767 [Zizania palustris]